MAAGIAEPASGYDIGPALSATLLFHQVLSGALECSDLSKAKSVARGKRIRVAQPHGLRTIKAAAILKMKSARTRRCETIRHKGLQAVREVPSPAVLAWRRHSTAKAD
jgi:hypothetical protein